MSDDFEAPDGCIDPPIGTMAARALGEALSPAVAEHLARCLACALLWRAFARFEEYPS